MALHATLFAVDCVAIFLALLFAVALVWVRPRDGTTALAALILVVSAGFVTFARAIYAGWIPEPFRFVLPPAPLLVLQVAMNTSPGLFMVLCFRLFQEPDARFPRWLLALFALQLVLEDLLPALLGITTHPSHAVTMTDSDPLLWLVFETVPASLQALFVAAALYWTVKDWRVDLVELRRLLRAVLLVVIGVNMVAVTLLTRLLLEPTDIAGFYVHEGFVAFNVLVYCAVFLFFARRRRLEPVVETLGTAAGRTAEAVPDADAAAFEAAMARHVYRESGLTIASLAARLKIPEYRLRRLIHTRLGHRRFNQMLHAYRIADAKVALADAGQRHLPILTIALSLGYQSINPFNRAFRALVGTTPSAYRRAALHDGVGAGVADGDG